MVHSRKTLSTFKARLDLTKIQRTILINYILYHFYFFKWWDENENKSYSTLLSLALHEFFVKIIDINVFYILSILFKKIKALYFLQKKKIRWNKRPLNNIFCHLFSNISIVLYSVVRYNIWNLRRTLIVNKL